MTEEVRGRVLLTHDKAQLAAEEGKLVTDS